MILLVNYTLKIASLLTPYKYISNHLSSLSYFFIVLSRIVEEIEHRFQNTYEDP